MADWEAIKSEYITTDTSQSKLAKKYGVSRAQISNHSRKEGWVQARSNYLAGVMQKTLQKQQQQDANRLCKLMDATNKLIDISLRAINDEQQYNRFIVSEGIGEGMSETSEKVFEKIDTRALKDTVSVLKDLTAMVRDFYDIPTAAQREQRDINLARLEMEKKKAEQETMADKEIRVVIPPELMELTD